MPTLVLDKSAIKAAPGGLLTKLRADFSFLLTDTLLYEIATERLGERGELPADEQATLDAMITANFIRSIQEAGNTWVERCSVLQWEMEQGTTGRAEIAPRFSLTGPKVTDILSKDVIEVCQAYEEPKGLLASVAHAEADEEYFQKIRRMKPQDVLPQIREDYCSEGGRARVAAEARTCFEEKAGELGLSVASTFVPGPDWLAFGMILAKMLYLPWKFWRYGDEAADPKKPANPWFDTDYVGYMAIADGLVSSDKKQLELAWACWPEKEEAIFVLDQHDHSLVRFRPEWST